MSAVVVLVRRVSSVASLGLSIFIGLYLWSCHHPTTLARWRLRYQGGETRTGMQKPRVLVGGEAMNVADATC